MDEQATRLQQVVERIFVLTELVPRGIGVLGVGEPPKDLREAVGG
jgi:hypothetical protein